MNIPAASRPRRAHAARAVLAAFLLAALAACGSGGTSQGHALMRVEGDQIGGATIRLGDRLGYLFVYLHNISHATLTINSLDFLGRGIGTVVRPVQQEIGPVGDRYTFVGGGYATDPPVRWTSRGCLVEPLRPLRAYPMAPGSQATIWVVLKAVGVGQYNIYAHALTYTQGGSRYRQVLSQGYRGAVARNGMRILPGPSEKRCLAETTPLNP